MKITRPFFSLVGLLSITSACSSDAGSDPAEGASGGSRAGSASSQGGNANGGSSQASGGVTLGGSSNSAAGGAASALGGASVGTGGSSNANGGRAQGGANAGSASTSGGAANTHSGGKTNPGSGGRSSAGGAPAGGRSSSGGAAGATSPGDVRLPPANAPFDYQIGGAYTPPSGVQVVSRDRNSAPASGIYNICYVNGFQTQPDEESFWKGQHSDLILKNSSGDPVIDADWGEMLLDTSTAEKRSALSAIVGDWISGCAGHGFDAVEIDNLDSYDRSSGLLTKASNIAFMQLLSDAAHAHGLAIAQKNSTDLLGSAQQMGTDFAVAEECNRYGECGDYQGAYGNLVFVIEYRKQDFQTGCQEHPELSIVLRDLGVSPPSSGSYVYDGC